MVDNGGGYASYNYLNTNHDRIFFPAYLPGQEFGTDAEQ
jgi:hypothetical protein